MIGTAERRPRLDHGPRLPRARARASRTTSSSKLVDTSDEWIVERTGIRERRDRAPERGALGPRAARRARRRSTRRGSTARDDRPDHRRHGHARHGVSRRRPRSSPTSSAPRRGRLRPLGRLHRLHVRARAGATGCSPAASPQRALVVGGDVLSKILDWTRPLDARAVRRRSGSGRARAGRDGRLPRLRARRRRLQAGPALAARRRLARAGDGRPWRSGALREDERPRGVQVRDARARLVRGEGARPSAA